MYLHWKKIIINVLLVSSLFISAIVIYLFYLSTDLPSLDELKRFNPEQISKIYSADKVLIKELYINKRDIVDISKVPSSLRNALMSMEDRNFFDHYGMSFRSIARAVIINSMTFSARQGASTITQQLARNMYSTIGFKKTINRKLKELITAIKIEQTYTKSEIMQLYFNSVYFGHGTYGIQSASKYYYGKNVDKLNLNESATLIGLLPAPSRYSPKKYPDRSLRRRNLVLRVMKDLGYINEEEYVSTKSKPLSKLIKVDSNDKAPYFTEHVRRELEKIDNDLNINLYKDGLEIHTTMDSEIQEILEQEFNKGINKNQNILNNSLKDDEEKLNKILIGTSFSRDSLMAILDGGSMIPEQLRPKLLVQGAAIVLDSKSGHILAMIGGRQDSSYTDHFNRSTQALRQPGSVFKPFIYLTALQEGFGPTKELLNQPLIIQYDDTTTWNPQNHDGSTGKNTTLREGMKRSLNLISVRVVQELVSPQLIVKNAVKFGITTPIKAVDAIALGVSEVLLIDITSAYATISNNGIYNSPTSIFGLNDRSGKKIKSFYSSSKEVLNQGVNYLLCDMMQSVIEDGTGKALWKWYKFNEPTAGKTGTTNSKADAWFIGFTPQITIGVWVGMDDPSIRLDQYGSQAALPIFARTIKRIYKKGKFAYKNDYVELEKGKNWEMPKGIKELSLCSNTFALSTVNCPKTTKEIFIDNFSPYEQCKKHKGDFDRSFD